VSEKSVLRIFTGIKNGNGKSTFAETRMVYNKFRDCSKVDYLFRQSLIRFAKTLLYYTAL
jgi:hypothetical protein